MRDKKHWTKKGRIEERINPRSYRVETEDGGVYRRNRRDIIDTREKFETGKETTDDRMEEYMDRMMELKAQQMNEPGITDIDKTGPRPVLSNSEIEKRTNELLTRFEERRPTASDAPSSPTRPPATQPTIRRSSRVSKSVDKLNLLVNSEAKEEQEAVINNISSQSEKKVEMDEMISDKMKEMEERLKARFKT